MQQFTLDVAIYLVLFAIMATFVGWLIAPAIAFVAWCGYVWLEALPPMRIGWRIGRLSLALQVA